MATLVGGILRTYELGDSHVRPMVAAAVIHQGAAVGLTPAGYARSLVAGDAFAGFADENADNAGGGDSGAEILTKARGRILLPITGFTAADVFKTVYASDDNTFTLTSTDNSAVGRAVRLESPGLAVVEFDVSRSF